MADLTVNSAMFEVIEDANYVLRLHAAGEGFDNISLTASAIVGDVPVERVVHFPTGNGFTGLLARVPPEGAVLRVGWTPGHFVDTAVTFQSAPNV
jgi:hypothetical protein